MSRPKPKPRPAPRAKANPRARPAAKPPARVTPRDISEALPEAKAQAAAVAENKDLPDPPQPPAGLDSVALVNLWRDVMRIKLAYEDAKTRLDEEKRDADATRAALTEQQRAWETEQEDRARQREEAGRRAAAEDEDLRRRRADCDEREQRLAELELRLVKQEHDARSAASGAVREALAEAQDSLDREREDLSRQREALGKREAGLQAREEDLRDRGELFQQRTQVAVERATEQYQLQLAALERRHADLLAENERLEQKLAEYERIRRAFPDFDPDQIRGDLLRLEEENRDLRKRQPRADLLADLDRLREGEQRWQEDRTYLLAENERLQLQLSAYQVTGFELDRQEAVKQALQANVEAYQDEVARLKEQAEGLRRRAEGNSPFPECSKMDELYREARDDLVQELPPLHEFVRWLRSYIAQQDGLFYSEPDLRVFLAGLAATRLHLLQGVSGIGKTQLPLAFAKAIGAAAVPVAVGADWRTPPDLTGYYNAFERRFYESEFTQAAYQAGCPAYLAQPFFLVLDEMNLSHPEQYLSTVLSALEIKGERTGKEMTLELMTTQVQPSPRRLGDGRRLLLPPNLWFVGTANQDETTVAFAEKTFDRSNVLELPAKPERFEPNPTDELGPISLQALQRAFAAAERAEAKPAKAVAAFLQGDLGDRLYRDFRISAGPRTMKQLDRFVPAVCAAGGTIREAADHMLAMKVLRKIRGRYEFRIDVIESFRDDLPKYWSELPGGGGTDLAEPVRSLRLLGDELHGRGGR